MPLKNWWTFLLLIIITALDLFLMVNDNPARLFSKALLMPILILAYSKEIESWTLFSRLIIAALFFSWLGDIFLLFDKVNGMYFILGLSSFLTAHVLYIIYFLNIQSRNHSFLKKRPVMLLAILAYTIELLYVLWPSLNGMKLPVTVYAIVISTMLAAAAWQYGKISATAAWLFITGALLFVLSDSALALNKFHRPFSGSGIFVMLSYVTAQTLIVLGSIRHMREESSLYSETV